MALAKYALASIALGAGYYALPKQADGSQVFAQPAATATERIAAKRRVVEGTGLGSLTIESAGRDGQNLLVGVTRAGMSRSLKCKVAVSPVSPQESRAEVDCTQPEGGDQPTRRLGAKALDIVVREHVAAAVESRPYDTDRVADRMIAFAALNGPALAASMRPPKD